MYKLFHNTILNQNAPLVPVSSNSLLMFISYLDVKQYAPATIATYSAAISYIHKISNWKDPASHFLVHKVIASIHKRRIKPDARMPITIPILGQISKSITKTNSDPYNQKLLHAMYLTAFFGMMRVGEITCSNSTRHNLLVSKVSANQNFYSLNINSYKHSPGDNNKILLQKQADIWLCPVSALNQYFRVRPKEGGPLFIFSNGKPVTRSWFTKQLEYSLNFVGADTSRYKSHSFRLGSASYAAARGLTDTQIKILGRWKSNAFLKYVRDLNSHLPLLQS